MKNIVSKRNHFRAADELANDAADHMPDEFKHPKFREWLVRYTETIIKSVASHYGMAAQRGIEQAAELLCDPEFYESRRRKRTEERRKWRESQAKQEWERQSRINCPTAEQLQEQATWHERQIVYYSLKVDEHTKSLEKLRKKEPTILQTVTSVRVQ